MHRHAVNFLNVYGHDIFGAVQETDRCGKGEFTAEIATAVASLMAEWFQETLSSIPKWNDFDEHGQWLLLLIFKVYCAGCILLAYFFVIDYNWIKNGRSAMKMDREFVNQIYTELLEACPTNDDLRARGITDRAMMHLVVRRIARNRWNYLRLLEQQ